MLGVSRGFCGGRGSGGRFEETLIAGAGGEAGKAGAAAFAGGGSFWIRVRGGLRGRMRCGGGVGVAGEDLVPEDFEQGVVRRPVYRRMKEDGRMGGGAVGGEL
jgi:hypothetical protein